MQKGIFPTDLNDPAHCLYGMKLSDFLHIEAICRNRQISRRMDTHGIIVVERFATFHYY